MSSDQKDDKPVATLTQDITDPQGRKVGTASAHAEFPNTALGNLSRVYVTVGIIGFVVICAMVSFFMVLKNGQDVSREERALDRANQEYMQKRVDRMWDDVIKLQNDNHERYAKSRELTEKRHNEIRADLARIVQYIELSAEWVRRGPDSETPRPKAPKIVPKDVQIEEPSKKEK